MKPTDLTIGQEVVVTVPGYRTIDTQLVRRAVVVDIKKAWIVLTEPEPHEGRTSCDSWRMRLDTQDTGDRNYSHHNSHFYTKEQWAERQLLLDATRVLREADLQIGYRSPHFNNADFTVALAEFVTQWQKTGGK